MGPTVIFDTNIVVAGLRSKLGSSHVLLKAIGDHKFVLGLTTPLVLEYESVLKRPNMVPLGTDDIDALIDYWCGVGDCRPFGSV